MTQELDEARTLNLDRAIRRSQVLVTTGAGGVGKLSLIHI